MAIEDIEIGSAQMENANIIKEGKKEAMGRVRGKLGE